MRVVSERYLAEAEAEAEEEEHQFAEYAGHAGHDEASVAILYQWSELA
jgi:hypothetical protein